MAVLSAEHIDYAYVAGTPILQDVSLQVTSGERVALHAPSGVGKSTLCQILAGYITPDKGKVLLDDAPCKAASGKPNPVQLIWQHPEQVLDPYLRISASLAEVGQIDQKLLDDLGILPEWLTRFPHELSGGQLQRCCIARTLATNPRFLIADEISTMLDAVTQAQIWEYLLAYCEQNEVGMVLVTHSDALRDRLATRIFEL